MGNGRKIAVLILLVLFLISSTVALHQMRPLQADAQVYEVVSQTIPTVAPTEPSPPEPSTEPLPTQTEAPTLPAESSIPVLFDEGANELHTLDLQALKDVNEEVLGWILIGGTDISYPLVQHGDNSYYLTHSWDNQSNRLGSIFLECQSSPELTDFHTLIYGHNMENGTMLSDLKLFADPEYLLAHPYIYITCDAGVYRYEIFSFYEAAITDVTYQIGFGNDEQKTVFLEHCTSSSLTDTGIVPEVSDRIITLSTCTNYNRNTRFVLQARLEGIVSTAEIPEN